MRRCRCGCPAGGPHVRVSCELCSERTFSHQNEAGIRAHLRRDHLVEGPRAVSVLSDRLRRAARHWWVPEMPRDLLMVISRAPPDPDSQFVARSLAEAAPA